MENGFEKGKLSRFFKKKYKNKMAAFLKTFNVWVNIKNISEYICYRQYIFFFC